MFIIFSIVVALLAAALLVLGLRYVEVKSQFEERDRPPQEIYHNTGLPSFSSERDYIDKLLVEKKSQTMVAAICCELVNIDLLRDAYGVSAVDSILVSLVDKFKKKLRSEDLFVQASSNEFFLVVDSLPTNGDYMRFVSRFSTYLHEPLLVDGKRHTLRWALGIVTTNEVLSAETLLGQAVLAKNKAKNTPGLAIAEYEESLKEMAIQKVEVEQELQEAITTDEFALHFQPVVDVVEQRNTSYEALLRWFHPVKGLLRPDAYLPVANQSDLILEIGDVVLKKACRDAAFFSRVSGAPVVVSVNVSERQVLDPSFVKTVQQYIQEANVDPSQLQLEVAEEVVTRRLPDLLNVFQELSDVGVSFVLDDFGAGQTSLGILRNLPMVSTVKVDRTFIENVGKSDIDYAVAKAVVDLANSLGMKVIAEGVERQEHADLLSGMGIRYMQGFLYQRPVPLKEIFEKKSVGATESVQ